MLFHARQERPVQDRATWKFFSFFSLGILCPAIFVCFPNSSDAATWSIETVDSAGDVGRFASLAIGTDNRPRIAYEDYTNFDLKYAEFDGSAWHCETVHATPDIVGQYTQLCLDSANHPHIAYQNYTQQSVLYASNNGSAWNIETANTRSSLMFSIAVDSQNRPMISSLDDWMVHLDLARRNNGTWSVETADEAWGAYYSSLAIDSSDHPWISYELGSNDNRQLKLCTITARHGNTRR